MYGFVAMDLRSLTFALTGVKLRCVAPLLSVRVQRGVRAHFSQPLQKCFGVHHRRPQKLYRGSGEEGRAAGGLGLGVGEL